ncbi:MAG: phosphotriesterase [Chloroflexi bacterium]|nr:phosphotriesterase [Chloroflexota bacterium]
MTATRQVNTVLGPVSVNQLGWVLMHEHVIICNPGWELDARNTYDRERDVAAIAGKLATLLEYGVKTLVDATPIDLGRSVEYMVEASKRSGVNIIASTGLYSENRGFPSYFKSRSIDQIADWMVWELTEGMSGTTTKAGAIKVATGLGKIGQYEEKALRAAARAHKRTGAPILTHTDGGTMGGEQVDVFEEEGVDLSRVVIGHCCGNSDLRYHYGILRRGANIGLDRIGITYVMPDEVRRGIAMSAIAAGYASQLVLSQDTEGQIYGAPFFDSVAPPAEGAQPRRQRLYADMMSGFIPKLRETGVSERSIEACMVDLPRKVFGD